MMDSSSESKIHLGSDLESLVKSEKKNAEKIRRDFWHNLILKAKDRSYREAHVDVKTQGVVTSVNCSLADWTQEVNQELAIKMLETSKGNRSHAKAHSGRLEGDMANDEWYGDVIGGSVMVSGNWYEDNYHLMDGHHRLESIKDVDKPIKVRVTQGVPYPLIVNMDQSKPRSPNDNLKMMQVSSGSEKMSTIKLLYKLLVGERFRSQIGKRVASNRTYIDMYSELDSEIDSAHRRAKAICKELGQGWTIGTITLMVMLFDRFAKTSENLKTNLPNGVIKDADPNVYWATLTTKLCCNERSASDISQGLACKHPLHRLLNKMHSANTARLDREERKDYVTIWMYESWLLFEDNVESIRQQGYYSGKGKTKKIPDKLYQIWNEACLATSQVFPELAFLKAKFTASE